MEDVRRHTLLRSPLLICGACLRVSRDSAASAAAQLARPALGGSLLACAALLYAFLLRPPPLLAGARDFICNVRGARRAAVGPPRLCLLASPFFPPPARPLHTPRRRRARSRPTG